MFQKTEDPACSSYSNADYLSEINERSILEATLWSDGMQYCSDLLASFPFPIVPVKESIDLGVHHVALRHDVDHSLVNALLMARLEHMIGIRSTYYLLHPGGVDCSENYFGSVMNGTVRASAALIDAAKQLVDLGHEVGLHNDLISLAIGTGTAPADLLADLLNIFEASGIKIIGSVSHGSKSCKDRGYVNYQIFKECEVPMAAQYRSVAVKTDMVEVRKYSLSMKEFGLLYEANFVKRGLSLTDSGGSWHLEGGGTSRAFPRKHDKQSVLSDLRARLHSSEFSGGLHCLVHPDHWIFQICDHTSAVNMFRRRSAETASRPAAGPITKAVSAPVGATAASRSMSQIIYASTSERFRSYDQQYAANVRHFKIAPTVTKFVADITHTRLPRAKTVLEVGCGQGEFLSVLRKAIEESSSDIQPIRCLGVDGSTAGIEAAAAQFPECYWIADSVESFLSRRASYKSDPEIGWIAEKFDLVVDKTGLTFISDYEDACRLLQDLGGLLNFGGEYIYIASRAFYNTKLVPRQRMWPRQWMDLLEHVFDEVGIYDDGGDPDRGYYKRVYRRRAAS